jgi:CheY-like chemotaxis protein
VTPTPGKRIVVADDDHDSANTLAQLLRLKGHDVFVAYDGRSALEVVRRVQPDVVLLDIAMPRLDGCETARRLRAEPGGAKLLIIAITGLSQVQLRRSTDLADFDFYFLKPVDLPSLEGLLASHPGAAS